MHHHHHHHHLHARSPDSNTDNPLADLNLGQAGSTIQKQPIARVAARENDLGEKPVSANTETLPIVLGIVIPTIVAACILYLLHRRNMSKLRAEDAKEAEQDLDYGIANGGKKRKSMFALDKQLHKPGQLSMDMNLSSPYLLNPGFQGSHDSVHSLAKSFGEHDPYRVVEYASDTGSVRSFDPSRKERSPFGPGSPVRSMPVRKPAPPRRISTSQTNDSAIPSPNEKIDPFETPQLPEPTHQTPVMGEVRDSALPVKPIVPAIETVGHVDDHGHEATFDMPSPPPKSAARDQSPPKVDMPPMPNDEFIGIADGHDQPPHQTGLGLDFNLPNTASPTIELPPASPEIVDYMHAQSEGHYEDHVQPQIQTSEHYEHDELRGRAMAGQESVYYENEGGLGVPAQETKRLSVGFRPLPPDEVMESEDPEYRANRIRSFYKEYFEESKDSAPPLPGQPHVDYYDEYDTSYLADAAYYDADTNAFVMPYAQPVTRRAMTPPPGGRRGPPGGRGRGPPGGRPRGPHGSVGGMGMGRPRAGSAFGPRPGSSASAMLRGQPKKKLPPPAALSTLPTPSKLKDDNFALFNATDFAPPETFKDHAAGRSQSPLGERKPYSPTVRAATTLVTAFDELSVLPSPHLLRKSSTFTGLDFAPPKKFKDNDTMSDAGSIRSNRSGISNTQLSAIRAGAGRVSRLPGDTVFTSAAEIDQLKPQWTMRT